MDEKSVRSIRTLVSRSGALAGDVIPPSTAASLNQRDARLVCPVCGGTGWKTIDSVKEKRVTRCTCTTKSRAERLLAHAHIPPRYESCELSTYNADGPQRGVAPAKIAASKFVEQYPLDKTGVLLIGPSGVGKTHLAVAMLKHLVLNKAIPCLFCDYRDLLKQIQNSYNPSVKTTELELLRPIFNAEVLVIDDLGAQKPNEWVWDTVALILNTRYNDNQSTIITTNYPDRVAGAGLAIDKDGIKPAKYEDTLGDRIGDRMRSRLAEMCVRVEMKGD